MANADCTFNVKLSFRFYCMTHTTSPHPTYVKPIATYPMQHRAIKRIFLSRDLIHG